MPKIAPRPLLGAPPPSCVVVGTKENVQDFATFARNLVSLSSSLPFFQWGLVLEDVAASAVTTTEYCCMLALVGLSFRTLARDSWQLLGIAASDLVRSHKAAVKTRRLHTNLKYISKSYGLS